MSSPYLLTKDATSVEGIKDPTQASEMIEDDDLLEDDEENDAFAALENGGEMWFDVENKPDSAS